MIGFSAPHSGGGSFQQSNIQVTVNPALGVADGVAEHVALIWPDTLTDLGTFSTHMENCRGQRVHLSCAPQT